MSRKKTWIPAALCALALTACSPTEWAAQVVSDQVVQVKRYPQQQRPSIGYASASKGYVWKKGEQTEPREAWQHVPEVKSMLDPEEVDLARNTGTLVRVKTISDRSLEAVVKEAAAYEYKHEVDEIHIDSEIVEGDYVLASFPYVYRGEPYQGVVMAKRKGNSYIYESLSFSPELTDEGKQLPFVPGNGGVTAKGEEPSGIPWIGGTVNDERIRNIVLNYADSSEIIPIAEEQATYLIADNGERDYSDVRYVEGQDGQGKALYTWQF